MEINLASVAKIVFEQFTENSNFCFSKATT